MACFVAFFGSIRFIMQPGSCSCCFAARDHGRFFSTTLAKRYDSANGGSIPHATSITISNGWDRV
jgi:hypothetical protein